jgi:hypothetical protein
MNRHIISLKEKFIKMIRSFTVFKRGNEEETNKNREADIISGRG